MLMSNMLVHIMRISPAESSMRTIIHRLLPGVCLGSLIVMVGCKNETAAPPASPPKVTVSKPIVKNNVVDFEEYNGYLIAKDPVQIRSRVRGYVKTIHFKDPTGNGPGEGELVKKGDPLFDLDPEPFKDEIKRANDKTDVYKAQRVEAQLQYERMAAAKKTGAASQQEVDRAEAGVKSMEAQVKAQETEVKVRTRDLEEYSKIAAPIDGRIGRSLVSRGELVEAGDKQLATINSVDPIKIEFYADEVAVQRYRKRAMSKAKDGKIPTLKEMKIPVKFALDTDESFNREAVIDFADNQADPKTGNVLVRAETGNKESVLLPGDHVRVRVPVSDEYQAVMVPDTAVNTDQDKKYLLVIDEKNVAQRRDVRLGKLTDNGMRVIETNLGPNDRVIIEGTQRARIGMPVTPEEKDLAKEITKSVTPPGK
jgi:multidrug efflux system membrane fusion protein